MTDQKFKRNKSKTFAARVAIGLAAYERGVRYGDTKKDILDMIFPLSCLFWAGMPDKEIPSSGANDAERVERILQFLKKQAFTHMSPAVLEVEVNHRVRWKPSQKKHPRDQNLRKTMNEILKRSDTSSVNYVQGRAKVLKANDKKREKSNKKILEAVRKYQEQNNEQFPSARKLERLASISFRRAKSFLSSLHKPEQVKTPPELLERVQKSFKNDSKVEVYKGGFYSKKIVCIKTGINPELAAVKELHDKAELRALESRAAAQSIQAQA